MRFLLISTLWVNLAYSQNIEDSLLLEIRNRPDNQETVDWINETAFPYWKSDVAIMEKLVNRALELAEKIDYTKGIAESHHYLGVVYWVRDLYDQATEHYLIALENYQSIGYTKGIANVTLNMASIFDDLKQHEKAREYGNEALKTLLKIGDSTRISVAMNNLGSIYDHLEYLDSAVYFYRQALQYRAGSLDTFAIAMLINNIGTALVEMDSAGEALDHYLKAKKLLGEKGDFLRNDLYANIGYAYLVLQKPDLGLIYLDSGLALAIELDYKHTEQNIYTYLREFYETTKSYPKAFEFLQKEFELDKELRGEEVHNQIEVLQLKYEDAKKEKQLALLEKEKAEERYQLILMVIAVGSLFVVALAIAIAQRAKVNRNRAISRLKEQQLQGELDRKNRELTSYTLNFIQKNELLNELSEKVSELKGIPDQRVTSELGQLNKLINSSMRIDQDWENFRVMFEDIHTGFFTRLKEAFPDLGNAELKLCALLRLNLNLKESSRILGISSDSVKTARSRLRKKLGLNTEENLVDFLITFDKGI